MTALAWPLVALVLLGLVHVNLQRWHASRKPAAEMRAEMDALAKKVAELATVVSFSGAGR